MTEESNVQEEIVNEEIVEDVELGEVENEDDEIDLGYEPFNPTNLDGYDPEDEIMAEQVGKYIEELEELGLKEEQIKSLGDKFIKKNSVVERSPEEIKKVLNESLTPTEKRSYKNTVKFITESLQGTEYEGAVKDLKSNPHFVKIFTVMANKQKGISNTKKQSNQKLKTSKSPQTYNIPSDKAFELYNKFLTENSGASEFEAKNKQFIDRMISLSSDKEATKKLLKDYY